MYINIVVLIVCSLIVWLTSAVRRNVHKFTDSNIHACTEMQYITDSDIVILANLHICKHANNNRLQSYPTPMESTGASLTPGGKAVVIITK